MAYFLIFAGIILTVCSFGTVCRKNNGLPTTALPFGEGDKAKGAVNFQDALFPAMQNAADSGMLYELKEKVEARLAELSEQKELVTHLMLRVEKRLSSGEDKAVEKPTRHAREDNIPSADYLERARLHNDIYLLHDLGVPLAEIARQVRRGKGEVQLVLGLRNI
ncbi:MAG: hypothetical protein KGZ79_02450 [Dethiobacter sp.]|jgi:hypothetical protein|nr:hypothetical protein [Dethiobacter sp.]